MKERRENVEFGQVRANAQRENGDGRQREARRAAQRSRSIDRVLAEMVEPCPAPLLPDFFVDPQSADGVRQASSRGAQSLPRVPVAACADAPARKGVERVCANQAVLRMAWMAAVACS
jgi:hypothetical protein